MGLIDRLKRGWSAFSTSEIDERVPNYSSDAYRPGARNVSFGVSNITSIITTIYTQIAVDVSQIDFRHVKVDEDDNYVDTIQGSSLNKIFKIAANEDQESRQFFIDLVYSMLEEGYVGLVPTQTDVNPKNTDAYSVYRTRVSKIIDWYPHSIKLHSYDENTGKHKDIILPKRIVPIIENPFYTIMNTPNSTVARLRWLLMQIDKLNNSAAEGKLDVILQVPYSTATKARQELAKKRKQELEDQLINSRYGIAYIDSAEKVTQLNRPAENTLLQQAERVKQELLNQLGMTESIFNGTASEAELLNYYNRTINPICSSIAQAIIFKWLSPTAITQGQSIMYFRDPFKLVPLSSMAELADKLTRNEIMTSNELRSKIALKPSKEENANRLHNSNLYDKSKDSSSSNNSSITEDEQDLNKPKLPDASEEDYDYITEDEEG